MGDKKDLTRIEDLSEYLHQEDPDTEKIFEKTAQSLTRETETILPNTPDNTLSGEDLPETPAEESSQTDFNADFTSEETPEETPPEQTTEDFSETNDFASEESAFESSDFESGDSFTVEDSSSEFESETQEMTPENQDFSIEDNSFSNDIEFATEEVAEEPQTASQKIDVAPISEEQPLPPPRTPRQETFTDVKEFAQNITYGRVSIGGNPPFSIILKNIKYLEEAEEIKAILSEHGLINEQTEKDIQTGLEHGSLIIPQISEYAAIYLTHKFRRFDLEVLMGPSEEIHPSTNYKQESRGLISKQNLQQNVSESVSLEDNHIDESSIVLATTPNLTGSTILKYINVASSHSTVSEEELQSDSEQVYQQLAENLREQAYKQRGNAVVNINYQLSPLNAGQYKIICTGNIVWLTTN